MLSLSKMDLDKIMEIGLNFFHIEFKGKTIEGLLEYAFELKKWNARINLTGLKELDKIACLLLYDAFFLHGHIKEMGTIMDLGSGGGILAIPLALLNENMKIISVDKSLKKIQFQRHIKRILKLNNLSLTQGRSETLPSIGADALIVKGFGSIETILEKGGDHINTGGSVFMLKSKNEHPAEFIGFELKNTIPYILPVSNRESKLIIYKKI